MAPLLKEEKRSGMAAVQILQWKQKKNQVWTGPIEGLSKVAD